MIDNIKQLEPSYDFSKFVYRMDSRGFYKSNNHLINWFKDSISY